MIFRCFTIQEWLFFVEYLNDLLEVNKRRAEICYGIFLAGFGFILLNIGRALHYSHQNADFRSVSIYFYLLTKYIFHNDYLLLFSIIFTAFNLITIIDYFHFRFMKLFPKEFSDLLELLRFNIHYHFTILDILLTRNSFQSIRTMAKTLAGKFSFSINRYLITEDFEYLFNFFKLVEISFFLPMIINSTLVLLLFNWAFLVFVPITVQSTIEHIIIQALIIVGLASSWAVILIIIFFLKIYIRPWIRHTQGMVDSGSLFSYNMKSSKGQETEDWIEKRIEENRRAKTFVRKLYFGRRLFVISLIGMIRLNSLAISTVISISVILSLIGNVVVITETILGNLNLILKMNLLFICLLQFLFFGSFLDFFALSMKHFYRPSKLYLDHYVKLSRLSGARRQWKELFCLSRFIETIHPETHWSFRLGMLGKITRKNLLCCGVVYTSMIMFIFPFIY